jgi:hypothetical protein
MNSEIQETLSVHSHNTFSSFKFPSQDWQNIAGNQSTLFALNGRIRKSKKETRPQPGPNDAYKRGLLPTPARPQDLKTMYKKKQKEEEEEGKKKKKEARRNKKKE